jgi:hypothetical protein
MLRVILQATCCPVLAVVVAFGLLREDRYVLTIGAERGDRRGPVRQAGVATIAWAGARVRAAQGQGHGNVRAAVTFN